MSKIKLDDIIGLRWDCPNCKSAIELPMTVNISKNFSTSGTWICPVCKKGGTHKTYHFINELMGKINESIKDDEQKHCSLLIKDSD